MASDAKFLIEVATPGGPRLETTASKRVIEGTPRHFDDAAEVAREAAARMEPLFRGSGGPDEGSVTFGLSFEGQAGIPMFAKGTVGTSLTVTLTWKGDRGS